MMTLVHMMIRKSRMARRYWRENGSYLLLCKAIESAAYSTRDWFISKKSNQPLHLGKSPKLYGLSHITFGRNFRSGKDLWLEAITSYQGISYNPRIIIGDNVGLSDSVHIGSTCSIIICDGVLIGSGVVIVDHNHGIYTGEFQSSPDMPPSQRKLDSSRQVLIGRNVWIGDGVVVLPGATIGDGSVIGANSVVTGCIPANCIAIGSPARPVRYFDKYSKAWMKG